MILRVFFWGLTPPHTNLHNNGDFNTLFSAIRLYSSSCSWPKHSTSSSQHAGSCLCRGKVSETESNEKHVFTEFFLQKYVQFHLNTKSGARRAFSYAMRPWYFLTLTWQAAIMQSVCTKILSNRAIRSNRTKLSIRSMAPTSHPRVKACSLWQVKLALSSAWASQQLAGTSSPAKSVPFQKLGPSSLSKLLGYNVVGMSVGWVSGLKSLIWETSHQ